MNATLSYLLPHGYPHTVAPSYASYARWTFLASVFSSTNGGEEEGEGQGRVFPVHAREPT